MCYFDCFVAEWGTHAHRELCILLRFAPNLQAIESCDVIRKLPFPLTQRLTISSDITKEKEIYFDSKEFLPLESLV